MPRFSKLHLSLRFSHQKPVLMFLLPHVCYMPHPAHPPRLMKSLRPSVLIVLFLQSPVTFC